MWSFCATIQLSFTKIGSRMKHLLKRIFRQSDEQLAWKLLKKNKRIIKKSGGNYKFLMSYLGTKNALSLAYNIVGLEFDENDSKSLLTLASLGLLYEIRLISIEYHVKKTIAENIKDLTAEELTDKLIGDAKNVDYRFSEKYEVAVLMHSNAARMVRNSEVKAASSHLWGSQLGRLEEFERFDLAKREVASELVDGLQYIYERPKEDHIPLYVKLIGDMKSENVQYWNQMAIERDEVGKESFQKWEEVNIATLKLLVLGG